MKLKKEMQPAFTLIEVLLYVVLAGGVLSAGVKFLWDFVKLEIKNDQRQEMVVDQVFAMERFAELLQQANRVISVNNSQIDLEVGGVTKSLRLANNRIEESQGNDWYVLTGVGTSQVGEFIDQSGGDKKAQIFSLHLGTEKYGDNLEGRISVSARGQFNQGRRVLFNVGRAELTNTSQNAVRELHLFNESEVGVTVKSLRASWSQSGNRLREVLWNGNVIWSGAANSGTTVNFNQNQTIGGNGSVELGLAFNDSLDGETLQLVINLIDESEVEAELHLSGNGGGTMTCSSYCQENGYADGVCRNNWRACVFNGETHESGGDQYCTGGANRDTCCCSQEEVKTCKEICQDLGYSTGKCRRNARACKNHNEVHEREGDQYCTGGWSEDTCCCGREEIHTCAEVCRDLGYDDGKCRRNAHACRRNGETHESGGDQYCTGGANRDTCCCSGSVWGGGFW